MAAAAGEHYALDWRSANQARLIFPSIHTMLELEKSFRSIRIHVIGDRRAALSDGLAQHLGHSLVELDQLSLRNCSGAAARTDARPKQRFVSINISHAS